MNEQLLEAGLRLVAQVGLSAIEAINYASKGNEEDAKWFLGAAKMEIDKFSSMVMAEAENKEQLA